MDEYYDIPQSNAPKEETTQKTEETKINRTNSRKKKTKPAILMHSTPDGDLRTDSWSDEDDYDSTDLEIDYALEDEEMDNKMILARVTRLGNLKGIWNSSSEFYTLTLAFLISPDAIISAIYGFRKFGAGIWLPTALGMGFIAFPVMVMEFSLGQYTSSSIVSVFHNMVPALSAISALMIFMNVLVTLNDFNLLAMTASVLNDVWTTKSQMSAATCFNPWNNIGCNTALNFCAKISAQTGTAYIPIQGRCVQKRWYTEIIQMNIEEQHQMRELTPEYQFLVAHLTGSRDKGYADNPNCTELLIIMSFTFITLLIIQTFPHRIVVHLSKLPLLLIFVLFATVLVCSCLRPLESDHIGFDIKTDPIKWLDMEFLTWITGHIFFVSKIGQGCLISIGAQNPFRNNIFKQTIILAMAAPTVPHLLAYLIYPYTDRLLWNYISDFNKFDEKKAEFFASYDKQLNVIWSDALLALFFDEHYGKLFGTLFICTIISIFVTHKAIRLRTLSLPALEYFNITSFAELHIIRRTVLLVLFALFFNKQFVPHNTMSFYATIPASAVLVVFELYCVLRLYGPRRLLTAFNMMRFGVSRTRKNIWILRVREIYSVLLLGLFGFLGLVVAPYILGYFFLVAYRYSTLSGKYLTSAIATGIFLFTIPIVAAWKIFWRTRSGQLIMTLFKPIPELWGPREVNDRKRAEYQERNMRVG